MNWKRGRPPHDDILTPAEWRTWMAFFNDPDGRPLAIMAVLETAG